MSQENANLAVRWFEEVWNGRRGELIPEFIADECSGFDASGDLIDRGEFERRYTGFLSAMPDLQLTVESTIAENDEVVVRWAGRATHGGEGLGFEATNRPVEFHGLTWFRIRDGRFVEARDCWNYSRMVESLRAGCST